MPDPTTLRRMSTCPTAELASHPPRRFDRWRRGLLVLAGVSPLVILAGLYLLVTQVWMVPGVPAAATSADRVAAFIIHEKGLPRLTLPQFEAFLVAQLPRLLRDAAFRERFLAEVRTASLEEQRVFRAHLFESFKQLVLRDAGQYQQLPPDQRTTYLDERIVAYNRLKAFGGEVSIDKGDLFGAAAPGAEELFGLVTGRTTAQERSQALAYGGALKARVDEILASPARKAEIEGRIQAP